MTNLFRAFCSSILSRASHIGIKNPSCIYLLPSCKVRSGNSTAGTVNTELVLTRCQCQHYSTKKSSTSSSRKQRKSGKAMKEDKEAFFVVRKGDLVGVYKSLNDCQAQAGTSIMDAPTSVYKGNSMPKDTEKYLMSCGLKNALYTIRASDLTADLFGPLAPCPLQPSSAGAEPSSGPVTKKRPQEALGSEEAVGPVVASKHLRLDSKRLDRNRSICRSCSLEFDGASKGNPGQAGAGAILRSDDGSLICRLREGIGIATNNVAEYRAFILGLKYALSKGFTSIRVRGDSKLVCMQVQGLWKAKHQNILGLYEEALKLKDKFQSIEIIHVLRDLNSEADAQANLAVELAEGQVHEEIDE